MVACLVFRDAGSIGKVREFRRRIDVGLLAADNLADFRKIEGLSDPRSALANEGRVLVVNAGIKHRPDDVLAIHLEQMLRGIGLYGRNGAVDCRCDGTVQRDLEDVTFNICIDNVDLVDARQSISCLAFSATTG